jgi:hypothetical protein
MIAILDQGQHNVIARKPRYEFDGMPPRHIGVLHALQDMDRAACLDQAAEQQMFAAIFDEFAGDRIRLFAVCRGPQPNALSLDLAFGRL